MDKARFMIWLVSPNYTARLSNASIANVIRGPSVTTEAALAVSPN